MYFKFQNLNAGLSTNLGRYLSTNLGISYFNTKIPSYNGNINANFNPSILFKLGYSGAWNRDLATKKIMFPNHSIFIERDLHCWVLELSYNVQKVYGLLVKDIKYEQTFWIKMRIKAYPEAKFGVLQGPYQSGISLSTLPEYKF